MKLRKSGRILLTVIMSLALLSCGEKPKPELSVESYTELNTVLKLPPVYVPGGSWTEADIPAALFLGAKPFTFPATFTSVNSKFTIDPKASDTQVTAEGVMTATLLYDGCACGTITLYDCPSETDYISGKIHEIIFRDLGRSDLPAPSLFPIAFNGVTIGSSAEQVKENLGIALDAAGIEIQTSRHIIRLDGSLTDGVTKITLTSVL